MRYFSPLYYIIGRIIRETNQIANVADIRDFSPEEPLCVLALTKIYENNINSIPSQFPCCFFSLLYFLNFNKKKRKKEEYCG